MFIVCCDITLAKKQKVAVILDPELKLTVIEASSPAAERQRYHLKHTDGLMHSRKYWKYWKLGRSDNIGNVAYKISSETE